MILDSHSGLVDIDVLVFADDVSVMDVVALGCEEMGNCCNGPLMLVLAKTRSNATLYLHLAYINPLDSLAHL